MKDFKLGVVEARFADIIWQNEPMSSRKLAELSEEILGWKKSTTYTVLKRLCDKGIFVNNKGTVSSVMSKSKYNSCKSEKFVEQNFGGSLPAFFAAFTANKKLTQEEVRQLRKMVDAFEEND